MLIYILLYLAIAFLIVVGEAASCLLVEIKFDLKRSIIFALLWIITGWGVIALAHKRCKDFPEYVDKFKV